MIECPKCGGNATEVVIERQSHCSKCEEAKQKMIMMQDSFAYLIVRAALSDGAAVNAPEKFADWVWGVASALVERRPK